jgi:hypothetical protein
MSDSQSSHAKVPEEGCSHKSTVLPSRVGRLHAPKTLRHSELAIFVVFGIFGPSFVRRPALRRSV